MLDIITLSSKFIASISLSMKTNSIERWIPISDSCHELIIFFYLTSYFLHYDIFVPFSQLSYLKVQVFEKQKDIQDVIYQNDNLKVSYDFLNVMQIIGILDVISYLQGNEIINMSQIK